VLRRQRVGQLQRHLNERAFEGEFDQRLAEGGDRGADRALTLCLAPFMQAFRDQDGRERECAGGQHGCEGGGDSANRE
jgi:hypothetical protein